MKNETTQATNTKNMIMFHLFLPVLKFFYFYIGRSTNDVLHIQLVYRKFQLLQIIWIKKMLLIILILFIIPPRVELENSKYLCSKYDKEIISSPNILALSKFCSLDKIQAFKVLNGCTSEHLKIC